MPFTVRERAVCSWFSEDSGQARADFPDSATFHDKHGDNLAACDSWLCVCGHTDSRGGSWESSDAQGSAAEPERGWAGHLRCTACGRVYDRDGFVIEKH